MFQQINKYISVPQGRSCRFDSSESPSNIIGLYTDNFSECNVLILSKRDGKRIRISMTHVDRFVEREQIISELTWVRDGAEILVLRKDKEAAKEINAELLHSLPGQRIEQCCAEETFGISFCISGLTYYDRTNLPVISVHPLEWFFHHNYILNIFSVNCYRHRKDELPCVIRLLFDGVNWLDINPGDKTLLPFSQEMMDFAVQNIGDIKKISRSRAAEFIQIFFQKNAIIPEDASVFITLAVSVTVLLTENNYQKIFDNELSLAIQNSPSLATGLQKLQALIKDNFETFPSYISQSPIPQNIKSALVGIYKICCRIKQHTHERKSIADTQLNFLLKRKTGLSDKILYPPDLRKQIEEAIHEIRHTVLTSNTIVDRIAYPYFHSKSFIPEVLVSFKEKIAKYRQQSSEYINQIGNLPLPPELPHQFRSLEKGTFAHDFVGSLIVAAFGVGECSECSIELALKLIKTGFGNLAFVKLVFDNVAEGQEKGHTLIVANLPEKPACSSRFMPYTTFFSILPRDTVVIDAFLGIIFSPNQIVDKFIKYIAAYGGSASILDCIHLKNFPANSSIINCYEQTAIRVFNELKPRLLDSSYPLEEKITVEDTQLVLLLKQKTRLPFFSVRDENYKTDAIVKINTNREEAILKVLQYSLMGQGLFTVSHSREKLFVLEGINLADGSLVGQKIQDVCRI